MEKQEKSMNMEKLLTTGTNTDSSETLLGTFW